MTVSERGRFRLAEDLSHQRPDSNEMIVLNGGAKDNELNKRKSR